MTSVVPSVIATAVASGTRLNYVYGASASRGARVQFSFCKFGRAGEESCGLRWSQLRLNGGPNSLQSTGADRGGIIFRIPSASYEEAEAASGTVSPRTSTNRTGQTLEDVKRAAMRSVSNTNRGKNTTSEQRESILQLLQELEALNPTSNPVNSPLLSGSWALLYTAPVDEKTSDKYAGTEEGPFLARVKPAAFGSVKQTRSVQVIDSAGGVAENIAYFSLFGTNGNLNIRGSVSPAPPKPEGAVRVNVTFDSFVLTVGDWRSPTISLSWIQPKGWVDTTFLDDDLRVLRGDKGSIFLSSRMGKVES